MQELEQYLVDLLSYQGTIVTREDGNGISLANFLQPHISSEFQVELPPAITSHLVIPPIEIVPGTDPKGLKHVHTLLDFYFENYSWKGKKFNLEEYVDLEKIDGLKGFAAGKSESYELLALKRSFRAYVSKNGFPLEQANAIVVKWGGLKKINKDSRCWKICSSEFSKKGSMDGDSVIDWKKISNSTLAYKCRVSALTKVFAFGKPEDFFIYDSKISLLLNLFQVLILGSDCNYPLLDRNLRKNRTKIYSQKILKSSIRAIKKSIQEPGVSQSKKENFYFDYCALIKAVGRELYANKIIDPNIPECLAGQVVEQALFNMSCHIDIL